MEREAGIKANQLKSYETAESFILSIDQALLLFSMWILAAASKEHRQKRKEPAGFSACSLGQARKGNGANKEDQAELTSRPPLGHYGR